MYDGFAQGGHAEGDTFDSIEELIGSMHDDKLAGDAGENNLSGEGGDDELDGKEGDDRLEGGAGNDTLYGGGDTDVLVGGTGADTLKGGDGYDYADYNNSDAAVEVRLHDGFAQGGDADGDTFESIERINGSPHDDTLEGDSNENALHGLGGDDVLDGREGNDWLEGNDGADVLRGGEGHDIAAYYSSDAAVEVRLYDGVARGGAAEGDTYEDIEGLFGSMHDDSLAGDVGHQSIEGFHGNDVLDGREGDDRFSGGEGADTFVFAPGHGDDDIEDFGNGADRIDLSAFSNINSVSDLIISQQDNEVVIDLSGQGGGTITLNDYIATDITDADFIF